jgi:DNA recombination protein RmuC
MLTLALALGLLAMVAGATVAFHFGKRLGTVEASAATSTVTRELELARRDLAEAKTRTDAAERTAREANDRRERAERERAETQGRLAALEERTAERTSWLSETTKAMNDRFEAVAARIVDERAARVDGKLKEDLAALLLPLDERLREFRTRVDATHEASAQTHATLREQLRHVLELNQSLAREAHRLTAALQGSPQTQGAWGEIVLDRVLQASGLRRGEEYLVQQSHRREDGSVARPDVELRLPDDRWVVIDAKVSLVAWESYVAAASEADKKAALTALNQSVRAHLKGLVPREYAKIHGDRSVDFVVLFVPIEAAFSTIIAADTELARDAWAGDVLLASPSTLLFVLRTVAHLWRTERQELNAREIANRGAELYDKLVGFVADLESVGASIDKAKGSYALAFSKLRTGKGNAIRQAEMLRQLGVKPKKLLPPSVVVESAGESDPAHEASEGAPQLSLLDEDPSDRG